VNLFRRAEALEQVFKPEPDIRDNIIITVCWDISKGAATGKTAQIRKKRMILFCIALTLVRTSI